MKRVGCIFALSLCFVSPVMAAPPLPSYGVDINQTSVSGVSSGGAMAVQMHVAHSSIMRGVGVIAGVTYDCANSALPLASLSLALGGFCMDGSTDYTNDSINRTADAAKNGFIDNPNSLAGQKVWLFSGYNDGLV
ncbi:MAG: PHB depolymerase family esterase, partial [Pseudolabrys sp.]